MQNKVLAMSFLQSVFVGFRFMFQSPHAVERVSDPDLQVFERGADFCEVAFVVLAGFEFDDVVDGGFVDARMKVAQVLGKLAVGGLCDHG